MSKCRSCGSEIIWATTNKGRLMPVDLRPHRDGNIKLQPQPDRKTPLAEVHSIKARGIDYHRSHFATCRQAAKWRKKDAEHQD